MDTSSLHLGEIVHKLNQFSSPNLAANWDNVGLLVEPSQPHPVSHILLTNDLTDKVVSEAVSDKIDLIVTYHPPIFRPLKRLTQSSWKERILVKCIENKIAVYSPHTSHDALKGGVNDWLISVFGGSVEPIQTSTSPTYFTRGGYRVELTLPQELTADVEKLLSGFSSITDITVIGHIRVGSSAYTTNRMCLNCTETGLQQLVTFIERYDEIKNTMEITQLVKPPLPGHGFGRLCRLDTSLTIGQVIQVVKDHLQLKQLRLALAMDHTLETSIKAIAVCAGSGADVLANVKADLYITGEMSHHSVLDAVHSSTTVLLCEHSNTERGFLAVLRDKLDSLLDGKVKVKISTCDKDPLLIV